MQNKEVASTTNTYDREVSRNATGIVTIPAHSTESQEIIEMLHSELKRDLKYQFNNKRVPIPILSQSTMLGLKEN